MAGCATSNSQGWEYRTGETPSARARSIAAETRLSRVRRAHTPPPHIARKPKNVPMSGGTSRIGPEAVSSVAGRSGFEGSPTGGAVVSEESSVKPSSARTAKAGFLALFIDHSGARKDVTGLPRAGVVDE